MVQIHDIKPIVAIPDMSIYIYYGILFFIFLLSVVILLFLYKYFKPKPQTQDFEYIKILQNIDFKNSKQSAYLISKYGRALAKEDRQIRLIEEIDSALQIYKYKKNITDPISDEIQTKFHIFMESIDV